MRAIWVYLETKGQALSKGSLEALAEARRQADATGGTVTALLFGAGVALPGTLFEFLVVTALVMFVSSSARSLFTSRARLYLRQKNGHDIATEPPS